MRTEDFEKRPDAIKVLRKWYQIRDTLDEDAMEEVELRLRPGVAQRPKRYTPESSASPSGVYSYGAGRPNMSSTTMNRVINLYSTVALTRLTIFISRRLLPGHHGHTELTWSHGCRLT